MEIEVGEVDEEVDEGEVVVGWDWRGLWVGMVVGVGGVVVGWDWCEGRREVG